MNSKMLLASLTLALALHAMSNADPLTDNVSTFATGLMQPRGLKFGPDGNLYVAEAGSGGSTQSPMQCQQLGYTGGFTARISKITPVGVRSTVADNLPSANDMMGDVLGVGDIAFVGNTLYALLVGGGCTHAHPMEPNGVYRVNTDGTTTLLADLSTYLQTHPVAKNPPDFEPDGTWYNMITVGDALVALNPNVGDLEMITTAGAITRIVDTSMSPGHIVPTAVVYDGNYYLGNLGTFPIVEGSSNVFKITPDGQISTLETGFTTILGLAFDASHRLYVLENTTGPHDLPEPGTGKVVRVYPNGARQEVARGLSLPTAMTFGPDGNLYVSNWGFGPPDKGEIVKVDLQPATPLLANLSARGFVQSGDNVLIGGLIIGGRGTEKILIRGIGPSLTAFKVANALPDPTVSLYDVNGVRMAFDDNWQDDAAQAALINATGKAPGNQLEAAIVADLAPGAYTAIVASKTSATGVALVEFYTLDPVTGKVNVP